MKSISTSHKLNISIKPGSLVAKYMDVIITSSTDTFREQYVK